MRSRQLIFFTTRADITALMGAFEKEIKYARLGSSDNENISYCESLSNYPDVGYTDFEDWISLDNRFLIIPKSDEVKTRTVKLHDGQVRYITDLMQNPTGVELSTGGVCLKKDNVLIVRLPGIFEWRAAEQAQKIAFVRTVVTVEVGKQAVYLIIVYEHSTGIVTHGRNKGFHGRVDHHMTLPLWHLHLIRHGLLLALFGCKPFPFTVLPDFLCIDTVVCFIQFQKRCDCLTQWRCLATTWWPNKHHVNDRAACPPCHEACRPCIAHSCGKYSQEGSGSEIDLVIFEPLQ